MMLFSKVRDLLFRNTTVRQTVIKNTFWLGASIVVSRTIKAVLIIYAARVLGTDGYGIFSYAIGLASFFAVFSDLGVNGILMRDIAKERGALRQYLSTGLMLKLSLIAISVVLILFAAPFFSKVPAATPLLWLAAILIAADGVRDFFIHMFRAEERMETDAGITIFTNLAITVTGLLALFLKGGPGSLLGAYAAGSVLGAVVACLRFRTVLTAADFPWPDLILAKKMLREAWPFGLIGLLGVIMVNTDVVMLGWYKGAEAVGLYAAALRPVQLLYFLPTLVGIAIFPALARLAPGNPREFRDILERAMTASFLFALPMVAGGIILRTELIRLIFGAAFLPAEPAFVILLFTLFSSFVATFLTYGIFALNKQRFFTGVLVLGTVSNAILNAILIPRSGIAGTAVATVIAQYLAYGLLWWDLRSLTGIRVLPRLGRIALATLCMGAVTWSVAGVLAAPLVIIAGVVVYFAMLFLLREPLLRSLLRT